MTTAAAAHLAGKMPALPGHAEQRPEPAPDSRATHDDEAFRRTRNHETYGDIVDYEDYDQHWKPPGLLDAPEARTGFVQRWVAVTIGGEQNALHLSKRLQEGWKPRDPATVPGHVRPPTIQHGEYEGFIGVEGMVLMERPRQLHERYRARVRAATERQMEVVRQERNAEARPDDRSRGFGPIQDRSERSVSSGGRVMPAGDDD